jgi:antitoxin HicB
MKSTTRKKGKNKLLDEGKGLTYYMTLHYPYTMEQYEEEGKIYFSLSIPDLPGCGAIGETVEQALANLEKAKEAWIEVCLEEGLPIPEPALEDEFSGKFLLRIPPNLHMRLSKFAEREGKSLNQYIRSILEARVNQDNNQEFYEILAALRGLMREEITPLSQRLYCLEESFNNISDSIRFLQQQSFGNYSAPFLQAMKIYGQAPQPPQSAQSGQITYTGDQARRSAQSCPR